MPKNNDHKIVDYFKKVGIEGVTEKLRYLSHWLVYDSWDKPGDKTGDEWDQLVDKRWRQCEFLEQCQKWYRENEGGQGRLL